MIISRIKSIGNRLRLEQRISLILIALFGVIVLIGLLEIQHVTSAYDEEMYTMSVSTTKSILSEVDGILDSVSVFGDYFVGDNVIQTNLVILKEPSDLAERSTARRALVRQLNSLLGTVPFMGGIGLSVSPQDLVHSGDIFHLDDEAIQKADEMAAAAQGRVVWVSDASGSIYYVRQIRRKEYLKLDNLAVLYLKLDFATVLQEVAQRFSLDAPMNLSIYVGERLLYSSFPIDAGDEASLLAFTEGTERYTLTTINDNMYFVTKGILPGSQWLYIHYLDYQTLSKNISSIIFYSVIILLLAMMLTLIIIRYIIKRIIYHLQVLKQKMTHFESGNMDMSEFPSYEERMDELGEVHQHFNRMVMKYDTLIKDNYIKQLLIKDNTIKMLSQQINPHFLYNVLDSIYWLAQRYGADDIEQMSYSLAHLFRISISDDDVCVPLKRELELVEHYIKIQTIRFSDRLLFEMHVPPELLDTSVPRFSLQPLIENSIKHAMDVSDEPCHIVLSVKHMHGKVFFRVANTGSRFDDDIAMKVHSRKIKQSGNIGLTNIDERLQLLFGKGYGLRFYNSQGMAVVSFAVPEGK